MKLNKRVASIVILIGLLVGGLLAGVIFTTRPGSAIAAPASQTAGECAEDDDSMEASDSEDLDDVQEEVECGPEDEDSDEAEEAYESEDEDEADEVAPADSGITAEEAQAIVEAEYPNATTLEVEFERENGKDMFEVALDSGLEVMVDAGTGEILGAETDD